MTAPYWFAMLRWRVLCRLSVRVERFSAWLRVETDFAEPLKHVMKCFEDGEKVETLGRFPISLTSVPNGGRVIITSMPPEITAPGAYYTWDAVQ